MISRKYFIPLIFISLNSQVLGQVELENSVGAELSSWEQKIETDLEVFINGKRLGDFSVEFKGEELVAITDTRLLKVLKRLLKSNLYKKLELLPFPWSIESFPYEVRYDEKSLKVLISFDMKDLRPDFYRIESDPSIKYEGAAIEPAPLAGSLSLLAEKGLGDDLLGGEYFSTSYNTFINLNGYVLESQGFYEERGDRGDWFRGNTRIVKDFVDDRNRLILGDTSSSNLGFMSARNIGGIRFNREFSINPYERPFPQGEREFTVLSRSRVKTFVNGTLIKDEFLPAGNYKLSRLPLIDGINLVKVILEDAFGEIKVLDFDIPTSTQILKKGIFDFNLSAGSGYEDRNRKRYYDGSQIFSAYGQYGFTDQFTGSLYLLNEEELYQGGIINGWSTIYGNLFLETSFSTQSREGGVSDKGVANALTWQLQNSNYQGAFRLSSSLRVEDYAGRYSSQVTDTLRPLDYGLRANFSLPLSTFMSLGVGLGQSSYQDKSLEKRTSFNLSSNIRTIKNINISVFASRSKEFDGSHNTALSLFMTWNFSSVNRYISAFHDIENKTSRLSLTQDNNNEMYKPRYNLNLEDGNSDKRLETRVNIPTPMADFALKGVVLRQEDSGLQSRNHYQGVATLGTSLLFAANDGFSFALSRSNSGSFAIFNPSKNITNKQIVIRSTSPYADTETPFLGGLSIPNLVNYQYRNVQIDPTYLPDGMALKDEQFILHSRYKSGHLLNIQSNGALALKGRLLYKGKPIAFKVIKISEKISFTDDVGTFYFPGVNADSANLEVQGMGEINIEKYLDKNKFGILDLGDLELK